jgi:radical SAM superfamily enzyme YgiQ (UPF0313 family)
MGVTAYLADLRYDYSGFMDVDCMPLCVSYVKAVMDRDLPEVQSRLFAYPDKLWNAIESDRPDVLMLSNYCWNENLSFHFARLAKKLRPDMLVVMGGPNIPLEPERQLDYVRSHPEIDVYVLGEGDFLGAEVVRHYLDAGKSLQKMGAREIPSCIYRRPDGEVVKTGMWARHKEIDEIPSPWLSGSMDEFFDGKLAPMIETNRGCPFTCTFCVQGVSWYTKVHNFSKERIREELDYIADRVRQSCPTMGTLRIADSNYGMFERDVEISGYIGELQQRYGWPTYIDATTGKNRPDRIIQSLEKVNGALVLYQAVQSLDENVLRNVKRSTIKLAAYEQLLVHIRGRGLRSNSDLILGLPGETLQTHVAALHKLLDAGINQVTNFQLVMLKGSELDTAESRQMFSFDTRFRILPKNFGIYGEEKVFDVEEVVVATDTLSFDDYLQCRKYALVGAAFWRNDYLDDMMRFVQSYGVKRSEWLERGVQALENATGAVGEYLEGFLDETRNELFPTREACMEYYGREENFRRLVEGEIGDNVMHKHNAIATFFLWPEICRTAMDLSAQLLREKGVDREIPCFEEFWADFQQFVQLRHAWGHTVADILATDRAWLRYDFVRWLADGLPKDPSPYRFEKPVQFEFRLTSEGRHGLELALQVWTTHIKGLTKMVRRIQRGWQERQCVAVGELEYARAATMSLT